MGNLSEDAKLKIIDTLVGKFRGTERPSLATAQQAQSGLAGLAPPPQQAVDGQALVRSLIQQLPSQTQPAIAARAGLPAASTKGVVEDLQKTAVDRTDPQFISDTLNQAISDTLVTPVLAGGEGKEKTFNLFGQDFVDQFRKDVQQQRVKTVKIAPGEVSFTFDKGSGQISQDEFVKKRAELQAKLASGELSSSVNFRTMSEQMRDLAQLYADSLFEGPFQIGGLGGSVQAGISQFAQEQGDLPFGIEFGGAFAKSGAFQGKIEETLLKMMPMLTQQATKSEGSMRIVSSVIEALRKTFPKRNTSARTAREQMAQTLRSFFRFSRATSQSPELLNDVFSFSDDNVVNASNEKVQQMGTEMADRLIKLGTKINLGTAEEAALDDLIDIVLGPIDDAIERKFGGTSKEAQVEAITRGIFDDLLN